MIFPIGDDQVKGGHFPLFSYTFLVLNAIVFFYQSQLSPEGFTRFVYDFGSIPVETLRGENLISLVTSMFLHGSWMHLIGNLLFLWVFADNIEASVNNFRFFIFYLVGGLAAQAAHIFFNPASSIPTVGASGAISAVMGAYMILFPQSRIKVLFIVFAFRLPAFLFLGLWIWMQVQSGLGSIQTMEGEQSGVAWWAHVGGFAAGIAGGLYFRSKRGNIATLNERERAL